MEIAPPRAWGDLALDDGGRSALRLFAHPLGEANANSLESRLAKIDGEVLIAVGPEGGWTDGEVEIARQNDWLFVDFGPRILRVETAAIALASAIALRLA
jgi:16S rRNA (uracil1498-N3)-methyltransferase